jgi:hypothetical protein
MLSFREITNMLTKLPPAKPPEWFGDRWRELLIVCLIGLAVLAVAYWRTAPMDPQTFAQPWDHHKYIYIAQHGPLGFHIAPFCWRFLHPLVAGSLPWSLDVNFKILVMLETFLAGILVYYLGRAAGYSQAASIMALLVFYSIPDAVKGSLSAPWSVDQMSRMFVLAGFLLLVRGKPGFSSIALAAGVCAKETVVITAPLYYCWTARKWIDTRQFARAALFALPILATYAGVKLIIPAWNANAEYVNSLTPALSQVYNGQASFQYVSVLRDMIGQDLAASRGWLLKAISIQAFGIFAILPLFAIRDNLVLFVRLAAFVILTYVAMLFSSGFGRVLVLAFPAVALLAWSGVASISKTTGAPERLFAVAAIPVFLVTFASVERGWDPSLWQVAILAGTLFVAFVWRKLPHGHNMEPK